MNYYERHIGDYLKDTAHLSLLEHGVYTRLLDVYYTREAALPADQVARLIGARTKEEQAALQCVLREFFVQDEAGTWSQPRCEREIENYRKRAEHNRRVGKLGGRPRKVETQEEPEENPPGYLRVHESNPHETLASNQKPVAIQVSTKPSVGGSAQSAAPQPPPPFDGTNAEILNGKAVVPIAASFELPEDWGVDAEALGWKPAEVLREAEKFRQYWTAGKGQGTRRAVKGWRQTWSNWLEKAAKDAR